MWSRCGFVAPGAPTDRRVVMNVILRHTSNQQGFGTMLDNISGTGLEGGGGVVMAVHSKKSTWVTLGNCVKRDECV